MEVPASRILGMLAGVLIFLVGVFVLKAKPESPMHRLFFAFATADGLSTLLFDFANTPTTPFVQAHAHLFQFHALLAFLALLLAFAVLFPRPLLPRPYRTPLLAAIGGGTLALIVWHALSPEDFWISVWDPAVGAIVFVYQAPGLIVVSGFIATYVGLVVRLLLLLRHEPSASHRQQAAFLLGGMSLGYTPYATTTFVEALRIGAAGSLLSPIPGVAVVYITCALASIALAIAAVILFLDRREDRRRDRRVVLTCFGGVAFLTLGSVLFPGRVASDLMQVVGLVAYPALLAYAIARYEILDIGPAVRRTAMVSLTTSALAATFFVVEAILQVFLEQRVQGIMDTPVIAALVAGVATLAVIGPLARFSQRLAHRIAPEVKEGVLRVRQLEIYRHGLEAALQDGAVNPNESRVLAGLRASLGISSDDHDRMVSEIRARGRPA